MSCNSPLHLLTVAWGFQVVKTLNRVGFCAVAVAGLAFSGCNKSSFAGGGDKKKAAESKPLDPNHQDADSRKSERDLKLSCEDGKSEAKLVTEVTGQASTTVRLEGEFCDLGSTSKAGVLTVLFVLDYSLSMQGNDPEVAGSCGRLQAGEAILKKLESSPELKAAAVKVALQGFGTTAIPGIDPVTLEDFKANLTVARFCDAGGGNTNYEAAFKQAEDLLKTVEGNKVVYFITDGAPTVAGTSAIDSLFGNQKTPEEVVEAGRAAAESLRTNVKDVTLNVVFVGNVDNSLQDRIPGFDPEKYLAEIAGSPDHVRIVTSAEDLAAKIVTFETPTAASFSTESVEGRLEATNFDGKTIALESLEPVDGRDGVYAFVTESFELFGTEEDATDNVLTLSIKGAAGEIHTATAEIKFIVDESAE